MRIGKDSVASIHYTLRNDRGDVLDSSQGGEPLAYLHGHGNIVPGLERALEGKQAGDQLQVKVVATEAYGERNEALVRDVPRDAFPKDVEIKSGMQFHAQSREGVHTVTVKEVGALTVKIDGNHPLAGENLNFDVKIDGVRAATAEELSHGHVHGEGGHHHH